MIAACLYHHVIMKKDWGWVLGKEKEILIQIKIVFVDQIKKENNRDTAKER